MRNIPVLFLTILSYWSCAIDTLREEVSTYVYYENLPVKNAEILTWQGYEKGFVKETFTDSLGFFHLKKFDMF